MAKKISTKTKKPIATLSLQLSLSDLKKITAGGSSFGGDTWQQIKWGKVGIGLQPIEARAGAAAKSAVAKKSAAAKKGAAAKKRMK